MNFIKNIISHFKHTSTSDVNSMNHEEVIITDDTLDVNSVNCPSTIDSTSANLLASHSSDQLPLPTNNMLEVITDDKAAEIQKGVLYDVVDLTTMDSDLITLDDSQSTNEIIQGCDEEVIIDLDEFEAFMDDLGDEHDDNAPETSKLSNDDEVITLDDIFNPIIENGCRDQEFEKLIESQIENTDICGPSIESTFKATANDPITENACKFGEHEKFKESQKANFDNICDPTIQLSSNTVVNDNTAQTGTTYSTKEDTMNVQEQIFDSGEVCCLQEPLKSFDLKNFEEQIQVFKIFQNKFELPKSHAEEEELTRYLVEIEEKSEMTQNVINEATSKINTTENKNNVSESNINIFPFEEASYKNKVKCVKIKDLNNAEIEFSFGAERQLCKNLEDATATKDNVITIHDSESDFEDFIFEKEANTEQPNLNLKTLTIPSINLENPSTNKEVVPSTANDNMPKNYNSVCLQFPTSEETRKNENCEMLSKQCNKEIGTPLLSKNEAVPSTSNINQGRDYYRSLRFKFHADEKKRMRKSHKMPQGQEFFDLFTEQRAPMFILENKSVTAGTWCMDYNYQGVGFAQYDMPHEEASEEDKKAADETTKKVLQMYPNNVGR